MSEHSEILGHSWGRSLPWTADQIGWLGAAVFLIIGVITVALYVVDGRELDGSNIWIKPLKFDLSVSLHLATLAAIAGLFTDEQRSGLLLYMMFGVVIAASAFEVGYISIQAGLQEHSHFNFSSTFHRRMYALMGMMAIVLIAVPLLFAVMAWQSGMPVILKHGVTLGLVGGFILTLIVAGYLGSNGSHFVGDHPTGGATLPLFGWSLETGDLRPAHFFALHSMQLTPLLAYLLWRSVDAPPIWPVWLCQAAISVLTAATFFQALRGLPIHRMSG